MFDEGPCRSTSPILGIAFLGDLQTPEHTRKEHTYSRCKYAVHVPRAKSDQS